MNESVMLNLQSLDDAAKKIKGVIEDLDAKVADTKTSLSSLTTEVGSVKTDVANAQSTANTNKTSINTLTTKVNGQTGFCMCTHTKSGTTHILKTVDFNNFSTDIIPICFKATADFVKGDTFTVEIIDRGETSVKEISPGVVTPDGTAAVEITDLFKTNLSVTCILDPAGFINFKSSSKGGDQEPFHLSYASNITGYACGDYDLIPGDPATYGYQFVDAVTPITNLQGMCHVKPVDTTHFLTYTLAPYNQDNEQYTGTVRLYEISGKTMTVKASQSLGNTQGYNPDECLFKLDSTHWVLFDQNASYQMRSYVITVNTTSWTLSVSSAATMFTGRYHRVFQFPKTPLQFYVAYSTNTTSANVSVRTITTSNTWSTNASFTSHSTVEIWRFLYADCLTYNGLLFIGGDGPTAGGTPNIMPYKVDFRTPSNSPTAVATDISTTSKPYQSIGKCKFTPFASNYVVKWTPSDTYLQIYTVGNNASRPTAGAKVYLPQGCYLRNVIRIDGENNYMIVQANAGGVGDAADANKAKQSDQTFYLYITTSSGKFYPQFVKYGYPSNASGITKLSTRKYVIYTSYDTDYLMARDEDMLPMSAVDKRLTVVNARSDALVPSFNLKANDGTYDRVYCAIQPNTVVVEKTSDYSETRGYATYEVLSTIPDYYTSANEAYYYPDNRK